MPDRKAAGADCPPDVIEVRRNADGSLDEIVAHGCDVHLEQMTDGQWWLGIERGGYRQVVTLLSMRRIKAVSEMDSAPAQEVHDA